MLALSLKRARESSPSTDHPEACFADLSIPERSYAVLHRGGIFLMVSMALGFLSEVIAGLILLGDAWAMLFHEVLYGSFFVVGIAAFLESQKKLPPDMHRVTLALALLINAMLIYESSQQKEGYTKKFQVLWAETGLFNSVCVAYSVKYPESVVVFIMGWMLMILAGCLLLTMGFVQCCFVLGDNTIANLLGLEASLLILTALLTHAYCTLPLKQLSKDALMKSKCKFHPLNVDDVGEEERVTMI